jgi:hypothetical protein
VRAAEGYTLVFDLGRLSSEDHGRLVDGLAIFRELAFIAADAPQLLLVGGTPAMTIDEHGKEVHDGLGGRLVGLLRNA